MPKKQKDNRYRAKITVGTLPDGKPLVKYVSGRTKRELEEAKAEARAYYIDGAARREDVLFGKYAMDWYHQTKEPRLSKSSRDNYASMLNKHVFPAFAGRQLRAIQPGEIQTWLNGFSGRGKSTIDQAAATMRGIFGAAFQDGILERDPAARLVLPKAAKPEKRRALTQEERQRILKTVASHEDGFFLAVLYYLGLRRGEALGLKWGDFDWQEKMAHVQRDIDFSAPADQAGGDLKTDASDRYVLILDEFYPTLLSNRGLPDMFVFHTDSGRPLSKATFERKWISLMIAAGIAKPHERKWKTKDLRAEWDPVITPHYLRHNYVTMLWEAGVDPLVAMRLVGHKDYHTTVQVYTHLEKKHLKDTGAKLDAVFKKVARKLPDQNNR